MKRLVAVVALLLLLPSLVLAQVTSLQGTGDTLSVILAGAASTTEPTYRVLWEGAGGPATAIGVTTGVTAKTMLTGEAGAPPRVVKQVSLHNSDTASVTATIRQTTGGTTYQVGKYVLPTLATLNWNADNGARVTDSNGQQLTSTIDYGTVGAAAATNNSATETSTGYIRRTRLNLSGVTVTMRDTEQGGGVKIYDFPEGRVLILGAVGNIAMTTTSILANTLNTGVTCNWGVGTVTQASATVATTEQDIIPVTAWTAGTTINVANTATGAALAASAQHDGHTTPKDAYLNLAVAGATDIDADATVTVAGTIDVTWVLLGDF